METLMNNTLNPFKKEFIIKLSEKSESTLNIKFKDPRDALKYLVNNINNLSQKVVEEMFYYIEYGYDCNLYNIKETYQYLTLCFQVENFITYPHSWFIKINKFSTISEIKEASEVIDKYLKSLNDAVRLSHKFAVANTWEFWNNTQYEIKKANLNTSENIVTNEDIKKSSYKPEELFCSLEGYKGKNVQSEIGFLLTRKLWKVTFTDGSWIIAGDRGNGWYQPISNFDSYKITTW